MGDASLPAVPSISPRPHDETPGQIGHLTAMIRKGGGGWRPMTSRLLRILYGLPRSRIPLSRFCGRLYTVVVSRSVYICKPRDRGTAPSVSVQQSPCFQPWETLGIRVVALPFLPPAVVGGWTLLRWLHLISHGRSTGQHRCSHAM